MFKQSLLSGRHLLLTAGLALMGLTAQAQSQVKVFPNPSQYYFFLQAPVSGRLSMQLIPLSGPSAGNTLQYIFKSSYEANSRLYVTYNSAFYSGSYMLVGRIGDKVYKTTLQIQRYGN